MNKLGSTSSRAYRPDAQAFDEVKIFTVPRYKESGLSGDEWRISATIQFLRNGILRHERTFHDVESCLKFASAEHAKAIDEGKAYFAGEDDFCDQEGCHQKATIFYKLKKRYCRSGHESETLGTEIRAFCDRHKTRGDCGLDDADRNYELTANSGEQLKSDRSEG